nr:uncharacterized protein LOC128689491 [Cherax quadricarinatus]
MLPWMDPSNGTTAAAVGKDDVSCMKVAPVEIFENADGVSFPIGSLALGFDTKLGYPTLCTCAWHACMHVYQPTSIRLFQQTGHIPPRQGLEYVCTYIYLNSVTTSLGTKAVIVLR